MANFKSRAQILHHEEALFYTLVGSRGRVKAPGGVQESSQKLDNLNPVILLTLFTFQNEIPCSWLSTG